MKKRPLVIVSTILLVTIWYVCAYRLHNEILLPSPMDVFLCMLQQLKTAKFYMTVFLTVVRMVKGLLLAMVSGTILGYLSAKWEWFRDLFYPVEMTLKTVPNVCFIIISLIWLGSQKSVILVSFLVLFPIFFANVQMGIHQIPSMYQEAAALFSEDWWTKFTKIEIPLILPSIQSALQTAVGLGFKVSVMAEIIGRVQKGIGFQIDFARSNLDMTSVFAWTVWVVILSVLLDWIFGKNRQKKTSHL